jgi:NAD-dependent deacetylase
MSGAGRRHSSDDLTLARELGQRAERPVVFTGAGVSAESGIPTFRDALTGLWAQYDPEQLATEAGYRADPALVWRWYASRRERIAQAKPNPGHDVIADYARRKPRLQLITQNVDGLHQRAGSVDVIELHGNILRVRCLNGCAGPAAGWESDPRVPPLCARCSAPLRPDVVWFGEFLPEAALARAQRAVAECDLMIVVGTSALVYPAAELPFSARRNGSEVITVNPEPTAVDEIASVTLAGKAGDLLPRLLGG